MSLLYPIVAVTIISISHRHISKVCNTSGCMIVNVSGTVGGIACVHRNPKGSCIQPACAPVKYWQLRQL